MSKYNKIAIAVLAASAMISGSALAALTPPVTATATATWSATANKDTASNLVVTPLGSLVFDYAAGTTSFNEQKGLFDVSIKGQSGAGSFTLEVTPSNTTLTNITTPKATLNVGARWYGVDIAGTTALYDSTKLDGHNLNKLGDGSAAQTAQDKFTFYVASATDDTGTAVATMDKAMDGIYQGDVTFDFVANWS